MTAHDWIELELPAAPLNGTVRLPGSKSYTNRALIAAAMAPGESVLVGGSEGEDTRLLIAALGHLG
ncbi:MAG: 3-phosphoshikimate 1-carboxyvinyltransferase, partial [bacterium]|nr:3-phosphoshikimate 1-carboxyvinyltransferase [bacterium]